MMKKDFDEIDDLLKFLLRAVDSEINLTDKKVEINFYLDESKLPIERIRKARVDIGKGTENSLNISTGNNTSFSNNASIKGDSSGHFSLNRITDLIQENIEDQFFGLDKLVFLVGTSKTQLYKNLKELYGMTPGELIKKIRMEFAAETLFEDKHSHISEIAYKVGFNDPSYFTKCFRKYFGCTPSDFVSKKTSSPET